MKWKKWLSFAMSACVAASTFAIPQNVNAADGNMVTDADLKNTKVEAPPTWGVTPNDEQLHYMKEGLAAFCHFGPNTFNNEEWGQYYEEKKPSEIFKLKKAFDADAMVKAVKEAGFSRMILTAKHHDGFCLWASKYTDYDISSTDYKDGKGDILEEISDACTKYNVDMGCYLSPWDIHEDHYGCFGDNNDNENSTGITDYNELYIKCIEEICTAVKTDENGDPILDENGDPVYKYGNNNPGRRSDRFVEWWMDGAEGSGVHKQKYDWQGIINAIRKTNPNCQIFGTGKAVNGKNGDVDKDLACTGGIHWIGNEEGLAAEETWAKVKIGEDYESLKVDKYIKGKSDGDQWSVPECDTKLLSGGWFWGPAKQSTLRKISDLKNIYYNSVGHGATLLLNLSPNTDGKIDDNQMKRLKEFGKAIQNTFDEDMTKEDGVKASADSVWKNAKDYSPANVLDEIPEGEEYDNTYWAPEENENHTGTLEIDLGGTKTFDIVSIEEYIQKGQSISSFSVEYKDENGTWQTFGSGTTISSKKLVIHSPVNGKAIRIKILSAYSTPMITNVGIFKEAEEFSGSSIEISPKLTIIPIKNFTLENNWTFENNNTSAWSNADKKGEASFSFKGTKAYVFGTKDSGHGTMDVYIDEKFIETADTYSPTRFEKQLIYITPDLENTDHTVRLVCKEKAIGINCAAYYGDDKGIFNVEESTYSVIEGGTVDVNIVRSGGSNGEVTVSYMTESGGAEQGVNYVHMEGSVTFKDGETSKKITLKSLENERISDGANFYFNLIDAGQGVEGTNQKTEIEIRTVKGIINEVEDIDTDCNIVSEELLTATKQLKAYFNSGVMSKEDIIEKTEEVRQLINKSGSITKREGYSEENPFVLPTGGAVKKVEAELFQIGTNGANVQDRGDASNGKEVANLSNGKEIKLAFDAPKAGDYKLTVTYRIKRKDDNDNTRRSLIWKGTNVSTGSITDLYENNEKIWKSAEIDLTVSKEGNGELVLTTDIAESGKQGPILDKIEFKSLDEEGIPVEEVTLNKKEVILNTDKRYELLIPTITPSNASNQNVTFESSNPSEIVVSDDGVISCNGNIEGEADITVKADNGEKTATCHVKVIPWKVSGVSLNFKNITMTKKNQKVTLVATVLPETADDKNVTYESSNPSVATVDNKGIVTAVGEGRATITVVTNDNEEKDQCIVTVNFSEEMAKPAQVIGLVSVPGKKSIKVNWNKTLNADSYVVKVYQKSKLVGTYNTSTTSIVINKLKKLTAYDVKVAAVNKAGQSSEVILKTGTCPGKVKLKSARKVGSGKVRLTFKKIKGAKGYAIFYKTGKQAYKKAGTTKKTFFTVKKLKKGKKYTFQVTAYIKNGNAFVYGKNSKTKKCKA